MAMQHSGRDMDKHVKASKMKAKSSSTGAATKKQQPAATQTKSAKRGVTVARINTRPGVDPLENGAPGWQGGELVYERRSSIITNPDGSRGVAVHIVQDLSLPRGHDCDGTLSDSLP